MYPFGHLPGNLTAFGAILRRDHGFRIGPAELRDAARALEIVDVSNEARVRLALRLVLSSSRETAQAFDAAFDHFFFRGPSGVPQSGLPRMEARDRAPAATGAGDVPTRATGNPASDLDPDLPDDAAGMAVVSADDAEEAGDGPAERLARAPYSPLEMDGVATVILAPVTPAWRDAARALLRRLHLGLARRWRPGRQGRRFDLRRTWRASLQTGGEAVTARWLRRVQRRPRLVVLIDGSRSMSHAEGPALSLAVALAAVSRRVEVFVFSTALTALTREVRAAGAGRTTTVAVGRAAWGGGTSIGASLRAFLQRQPERQVGRDTLVAIVSDGLDVGEPEVLRAAMRELHRRAAGVVWLNPLLDTPGYEPTSRGMVTARPFITTLAHVGSPDDLRGLARRVRLH